ncbi:hypothetical protein ACS0TY_025627 [Phlomoides rotata]
MNEQVSMMNQQQQQLMNRNQSLMSMNQMMPHPPQQPQPQMVQMNHSYGIWTQPQQFQNPNLNPVSMKLPSSSFNKSLGPRNNWKGKRINKPNDKRRTEQHKSLISSGVTGGVSVVGGSSGGNLNFNSYNPPTLNELQQQNRLKTRKFFQKKKFNKNMNGMNMNMSGNNGRSAPYAPRNTTSFIIRAKKSGGIAPLVSPYPVTPAVLPTPILSPSGEILGDMAKEEWGVDGYGSMKGLIRLRSPGHEEEEEGGSSESDVEEHVEVERRLNHDLSRFEMIYDPNSVGMEYQNVLENRVDDQDTHIAQLEEENLILKERLFLMERELGDLRRRMLCLERNRNQGEDTNEEVVENESENESDSRGEETHLMEDNNEDSNEEDGSDDKGKGSDAHIADGSEAAETMEKVVQLHVQGTLENTDEEKITNVANKTINIPAEEGKEESIKDVDESIEANKPEEEMAKDNNVGMGVEVRDNVDAESDKLVVAGDVGISEGEVSKDNMVLEENVAN